MKEESVLINRWQTMLSELHAAPAPDFAMFAVANRELLDLAQSSLVLWSARFIARKYFAPLRAITQCYCCCVYCPVHDVNAGVTVPLVAAAFAPAG